MAQQREVWGGVGLQERLVAKRRRDRSLWHDRELLASKCVVEMVSEDVVVAFAGPADTPVNHTLGAAAAIEMAFAACAIEEGWIPPAIGDGDIDPKIEVKIPTQRTTGTFERVLSNSFAFGGNNASLLLERGES